MLKEILVPLDWSKLAECVLPHIEALAQSFRPTVTLLHVLECQGPTDAFDWHLRRAEAQAYLEKVRGRLERRGIEAETVLTEGVPPTWRCSSA